LGRRGKAASPIVVQYDAPAECPGAAAFAALVRAELAGKKWDATQPLQVTVVVTSGDRGYAATMASSGAGSGLERTVSASTCGDVVEMASAIIALAQTQTEEPPVIVVAKASDSPPPSHQWEYSLTLGYGAFTSGPADPVVRGFEEQTTFNPAQGVRLGFGVAHRFGGWTQSLHVSAAYYEQSTTTVAVPAWPIGALGSPVSIGDREVLLGTVDACPVHIEYEFLSLIPCGTFSMMHTNGNSGQTPDLETGLGGSARLRGTLGRFFAEAMAAAVGVVSSYEPPSQHVRAFYSFSLGMNFR
jgi:hypothetical protein